MMEIRPRLAIKRDGAHQFGFHPNVSVKPIDAWMRRSGRSTGRIGETTRLHHVLTLPLHFVRYIQTSCCRSPPFAFRPRRFYLPRKVPPLRFLGKRSMHTTSDAAPRACNSSHPPTDSIGTPWILFSRRSAAALGAGPSSLGLGGRRALQGSSTAASTAAVSPCSSVRLLLQLA